MKGPFWDNSNKVIVPLRVNNKPNTLYIENNPEEVRDGDYIRTSLGNGILQVTIDFFRATEFSSTKKKANQKEICTKNGVTNF